MMILNSGMPFGRSDLHALGADEGVLDYQEA